MSALKDKIIDHLSMRVQNNELDSLDQIDIINNFNYYLNLKTYARYAKEYGKQYNVVKAMVRSGRLKSCTVFNVKFIIDND